MRAVLEPVTIRRDRKPGWDALPDVEGLTVKGSGYGAFEQYGAWNVTHLATGCHVQYVRRKRDLVTVLGALDALNVPVAEVVALREKYGQKVKV